MRTARNSNLTVDHDAIRRWAEERGGVPGAVKGTSRAEGDPGMLRLDFPGYPDARAQRITWDEWFRKFEAAGLALLFQEHTRDGQKSTFYKLVSRQRLREQDQRDQGGAD